MDPGPYDLSPDQRNIPVEGVFNFNNVKGQLRGVYFSFWLVGEKI